MKTSFRLFGLLFILIANPLNGQIGNEIRMYVDSTQILVSNGRKMMTDRILDSDYLKAKEIYKYLTQLTEGKNYSAFYYSEDIYLNILFGDWENLKDILLDYKNTGTKNTYQNAFEIFPVLGNKISLNYDSLLNECQLSLLDKESKDLIEIILFLIKNGSSNEDYSLKLNEFQKTYTDSKYEDILSNILPPKWIKTSLGFAFGTGLLTTTGNLKESFGSNATFNISMDVDIQRIYSSLYLNASSLKLDIPFSIYNGAVIVDFIESESFQYIDAGFKCGYLIVRNSRLHFSPYLSISGSSLQSNRYDTEDDKKEYKVFSSFTCGTGVQAQVKLFEFDTPNYYYGYQHSFISIKIESGYNYITKFQDEYFKGNTPYFGFALLWGIGDF